jgi:deoxyribose-phosphate aldolase
VKQASFFIRILAMTGKTSAVMTLSNLQIAQMIDLSAVHAEDDEQSIRELVDTACQYHCHLVTTLPSQTLLVKSLLLEAGSIGSSILVGGNVGFPSGGQSSRIKIAETRELVHLGCDEIDMVINIAWLLSGRNDYVLRDIHGVVDTAKETVPGTLVKVILECHHLNADQIRRGCDLCIEAGAEFVKTGTGWAPSGATLENIALIKAHVGSAIAIKASGGIRNMETLLEMYRLGAIRFGIGLRGIKQIFVGDTALK